jgi:hypothetical protein
MQVLKQGQRANAGREGTSMLTVVGQEGVREQPAPVSLLDELVRSGAEMMLVAALEAEVAAHIERFADVRDENGHRLVVRNGYRCEREVLTGAGAVPVVAPRVNDKRVDPVTGQRQRFSSAILPVWARKSPKVADVLPLLYLHGLSSQDFTPALEQFLGTGAGLSAATITRLTVQWQDEARSFGDRSLADVDFVYLWVDGIHLNVRLEREKLCLLVMIGVRADGRKELVALTDGYRECTESWAGLLRDCKRRGMRAPVLAMGDGALGFWAALREVFGGDQGAALLVPQDGECAFRVAEVGASGGDQGDAGDLQRRGRRARPGRGEGVRDRLRRQVSQGCREDHRRPGRAAGVLQLPGRALDPFEDNESHRINVRDRPAPQQGHQGPRLPGGRPGDGIQAHRGRPGPLAVGERTPPGRPRPRRRNVPQGQAC